MRQLQNKRKYDDDDYSWLPGPLLPAGTGTYVPHWLSWILNW